MKYKKAEIKTGGWIAIVLIVVFGLLVYNGNIPLGATQNPKVDSGSPEAVNYNCDTNPAYTYQGWDKFNGVFIAGTNQIKSNGLAPVSSLAAPPAGKSLQLWINNASSFCELTPVQIAQCGSQVLQTNCYTNSTLSIKVFDIANNQFLDTTSEVQDANLTMGANGNVNIRLDLQGNAKSTAYAFGACIAIERPSTVTAVSMAGTGLKAGCDYPWTYTVSSTSNTYSLFQITGDKDALGDIKQYSASLQAGSSNPSGTLVVTVQPINYYTTIGGEIKLGIEKTDNADTTKTATQTYSRTYTIA